MALFTTRRKLLQDRLQNCTQRQTDLAAQNQDLAHRIRLIEMDHRREMKEHGDRLVAATIRLQNEDMLRKDALIDRLTTELADAGLKLAELRAALMERKPIKPAPKKTFEVRDDPAGGFTAFEVATGRPIAAGKTRELARSRAWARIKKIDLH